MFDIITIKYHYAQVYKDLIIQINSSLYDEDHPSKK